METSDGRQEGAVYDDRGRDGGASDAVPPGGAGPSNWERLAFLEAEAHATARELTNERFTAATEKAIRILQAIAAFIAALRAARQG